MSFGTERRANGVARGAAIRSSDKRSGHWAAAVVCLFAAAPACGGSDDPGPQGTGGIAGTGGALATGAVSGTGGAPGSGGMTTGGVPGSSGGVASGGAPGGGGGNGTGAACGQGTKTKLDACYIDCSYAPADSPFYDSRNVCKPIGWRCSEFSYCVPNIKCQTDATCEAFAGTGWKCIDADSGPLAKVCALGCTSDTDCPPPVPATKTPYRCGPVQTKAGTTDVCRFFGTGMP
jgi:hypothetical protein